MERRAPLIFALLLAVSIPAKAPGQSKDGRFTSQFLPAGRELRQRLSRVTEAVAEERFAEAAADLGDFFLDEELEDYFVDSQGSSSLKGDAQRLLLSLPREGRESYELQFGAEARRLLATAVDENDDGQLVEVMRKYFHTKAGSEAAVLWARRQLDVGRPLAAAVMLDRVLNTSPYAKNDEHQLSLLCAISWRLAGHPDNAKATLRQWQSRQPNAIVSVAGQKLTLFTDETQALAWLDKLMGEQALLTDTKVAEWRMHRGDAARNASVIGSAPVPTLRWHKYLGRDEGDDQLLSRIAKDYQSSNIAALPTVSPLVVKDTVLMRTPERLMAVDLATGKFVWRYPGAWGDAAEEQESAKGLNRAPSAEEQQKRELKQRIFEDRAYGQLASDGDSVYLLDDLGYAGMGYVPSMLIRPGGARQRNPGQPTSHNKLVALSLAGQGKLRWSVGGQTGEDEPKLAGAFFLGVPLVSDGQLYAMIELNGELRLVVLDPANGRLQWSQQLAHIEHQQLQILSDSTRRLSGATPSLASGILICPTSACSVVAIDLSQRKLLWGYQYEASAAVRQSNAWVGYVQPSREVGSYWLDATVAIADGKVVLTPTDSDYLICLDLVTGKEAWPPIKRADMLADMLYVACVDKGTIVLVGRSRVTTIGLADGKPVWQDAIILSGEMPSGRGFQSGDFYYLPTNKSELLQIDTRTGKIVQRTPTSRPLGNLVAYRDQLLSQQYDGVTAFYQSEALRTQLVERLQQAPNDPRALAQRAQLELFDGKPREALATLRKAHELDRTNDDTRALLVSTLLAELQRDFASYQQLAAEIEPLLDQPQQRREFLRLKALGLEKAGTPEASFATFVALAGHEIRERPDSAATTSTEAFEPQLRVRFDRWVSARMQQLYTSAPEADRAALHAIIGDELAKLPANPTQDQWLRVLSYFAWSPHADRARLELASMRVDAGDLLGAETLLTRFTSTDRSEAAAKATALLTTIYEKAGRSDLAATHYLRLRDHFASVAVHGQQTGQDLFDAAAKSMTLAPRLAAIDWPHGAVTVTEGGDVVAGSVGFAASQRLYPMAINEVRGVLEDGSSIVYDSRQRQIILRDARGAEWNQVSLIRPDGRPTTTVQPATTHAHLLGHMAIVSVGQELMAYNLLQRQDSTEALLWRQDVLPSTADGSGGIRPVRSQTVSYAWAMPRTFASYQPDCMVGSVASLSDRSICFTRSRDVICVDPLTGETQWERTLTDQGCEIFGDDELLFVVPPRSQEATVLSVADGRELGKRNVGAMDFRWATTGRHVLSCKQDGREIVAQLFDAWSEKTLWESRFEFGTRGTLIGRDEMAMLQPDGKLVILSIAQGRVLLDTKLDIKTKPDADARLLNVHVLRSQSQYFLQLETIIDGADAIPRMTIQPLPGGDTSKLVTGWLFAFDRSTLKPSWQSPAYISQYGLPLDQPSEVPVLVFLRQLVPTADAPSRETRTGVLVLDRRDGRLLLERDNIRIQQSNVYELLASPLEKSVSLTLLTGRGAASGKNFTFKFTDKPTPPSPPARTGAMSGMASTDTGGTVFQAIGRAIRDSTRPEGPELPRLNGPAPFPPGFPPGLPQGVFPPR